MNVTQVIKLKVEDVNNNCKGSQAITLQLAIIALYNNI